MPDTCVLAGVGGCVDAIGVLTLGHLFVSHMSGNTASLGASFGQGHWMQGLPSLVAVPIFVVGLFWGYWLMVRRPTTRQCAWVLLLEAGLLASFLGLLLAGGATGRGWFYYLTITPPLLAMGLQNATLRQVGRSVFPSTYITGVLDTCARAVAQALTVRDYRRDGKPLPAHLDPDSALLARRAAGVWFCYAGGAMLGSAGLLVLDIGVVVIPIVALAVLAFRLFWDAEELTD
jgi:uncharacterized membrane protein YoaK (UPF0700 family)